MIKVYGADWCGDTRRTLDYLESLGVDFVYIDVESDEAASQWVKSQNDGKELKPTVLIGDLVLAVPTDQQLRSALGRDEAHPAADSSL